MCLLSNRQKSRQKERCTLGFAVDDAGWPSVVDVISDAPFYFVDEARIGHVDGDDVSWVVDGIDDATPTTTALEAVAADLRARATALRECACPLCERWPDTTRPRLVVADGHAIEPIWASSSVGRVLSSGDGTLIVHNAPRRQHAWTVRRSAEGSGWTTIRTLTDAKRTVDALTVADGTYVAIMGYAAPKPPRVASTSADRGTTWTPLAPTNLPAVNGPKFVSHPHRPRVVHAMPERSPVKELFRSEDGGRTFSAPTAPTVGGSAQLIWQVVEFEGRTIVGARRSRTSPGVLAIAEGATSDFVPIDVAGFAAQGLWCSARGVLAAFGAVDRVPMVLRSHDEGRTWTAAGAPGRVTDAHLGPRWFALEWRVGVHASDDEGATWARVVEGPVTSLVADAADPHAVYVTAEGLLVRLRTGLLASHALPTSPWPQTPRGKTRRSTARSS